MAKKSAKKTLLDDRLRRLLAEECAKIIATEAVKDFALAKRKALTRLGVASSRSRASLPSNLEIEQALHGYQQLFQRDEQTARLQTLRRQAARAMRQLAAFRPRLVGAVLNGTAGPHTDIELHGFAETAEDVMFYLMDRGVRFEVGERRLRLGSDDYGEFPLLAFELDGTALELTLLCGRNARDIPYSPIDGRPMRRATLAEVEALLATDDDVL